MTTPPPGMGPDDADGGDHPGLPPELEQLLRQMLGPQADEVLRQMSDAGGPGLIGPDGRPLDLSAMAAAAGLPADPAAWGHVVQRFQRMMQDSGDDPVNWELATDLARQVAVAEGDPSVGDSERRRTVQALSVAELWLDAATELPPAGGPVHAWSRSEWVQHTMPTWRTLAEPVARSVADALATAIGSQGGPELGELGGLAGPGGITPVLRSLGGAVFGMQLGHAAGTLSREVFGGTDVGIPLLADAGTALVPRNVAAFADGLDVPTDEVLHFLALREAAHGRLFTHVTWLRGHLLDAVGAYARGITIDMEQLEEAVRSIDPTDPEALQSAMSGGIFAIGTTPAQQAALLRLETLLALVEGWVDEVTGQAARPHLPHAVQLAEMMRRRRAAGGPAEHTFATLVGLELRPRRSREAARLWSTIGADQGAAGREAVWDHPDLVPTAEDLDDPAGFAARRASAVEETADVDRALAEIFGEDEEGATGT